MNTSQYMDKQIMDLSASGSATHNKEFSDLKDHSSHHEDEDQDQDRNLHGDGYGGDEDGGISKEEIVPSYDFQPIRPILASSLPKSLDGASRTWGLDDSKVNSSPPVRNYGSVDTVEPTKVILEKDRNTVDAAMVAEIDRTMKKYTDHLLHMLEGVNARLTQLETSVNDLKVSAGNNQGSTEGKIQHLENILREVQTGVQVVKDKQEMVEAQLHLGTLQVPRVDPKSEYQKSGYIDSMHLASSTHQLPPVNLSEPPHAPPPPPSLQNMAPMPVQPPNQFPQNQIPSVPQREPYFPPPGQTPEVQNQQYQLPPSQQPHAPPTSLPHQQYQPAPQQQYSQPPQLPQQHPSLPPINPPPQLQSSLGHHSEESPYVPSQTYPPTPRPSSSGPPPSQQFYGPPSHLYEAPASRPNSGFATGYGQPSGPSELYPYGGAPSQYGSGTTVKPLQLPSPAGGGSGYPQLPTARVLPQALPASGGGGGSGSPGSGNRVPVDDVIDRVTTMGFPREHVRATVRKLTESGQSVDLNVVLDKLMNEGGEAAQPQRSWQYAR